MIIIKQSQEQMMLDDFLLEIKECQTLSKSSIDYIRERANNRLNILQQSIDELKKQIANPYRHAMMQEGVNPNES